MTFLSLVCCFFDSTFSLIVLHAMITHFWETSPFVLLSFFFTKPLFSCTDTWSQRVFGNLEAPVTNRKPYSLQHSQSLMVHGDLLAVFLIMCTCKLNSECQLYFILGLPSSALALPGIVKLSWFSKEVYCILECNWWNRRITTKREHVAQLILHLRFSSSTEVWSVYFWFLSWQCYAKA